MGEINNSRLCCVFFEKLGSGLRGKQEGNKCRRNHSWKRCTSFNQNNSCTGSGRRCKPDFCLLLLPRSGSHRRIHQFSGPAGPVVTLPLNRLKIHLQTVAGNQRKWKIMVTLHRPCRRHKKNKQTATDHLLYWLVRARKLHFSGANFLLIDALVTLSPHKSHLN